MAAAFHNEQAFFHAWRRGVTIAGRRWFGDSQTPPDHARTLWDLVPHVGDICASIGVLSCGQALFLAAMVSFYNSEAGGQMLRELGVAGLGDICAGLDEQRRRVVADLLVSYPGW